MALRPTPSANVLPELFIDERVEDVRDWLIARARECAGGDVVVDGGQVRYLSTAGLGVLVAAALVAQVHGGALVVHPASEQLASAVRRVRGHPIRVTG